MPMRDERVSLAIGGKAHDGWTDYEIDSDLLVPADDFRVSLAFPAEGIPEVVVPGAAVTVRVGDDVVLTGQIDQVNTETAKDGKQLTLQGRDGAAVLLDCSCPLFDALDMDVAAIAERIVKPLGISNIRIAAESAGKKSKVQIEPGQRAWDALTAYAEANGVWPWFTPDGTLVIGGPDYSTPPVADLLLRRDGRNNNVLTLNIQRDISARYSEITVLGQSHKGARAIKAVARDSDVSNHRPLVVVDGEVDSQAQAERRARKLLADSRLAGLSITATVQGHRTDDGTLWTPGQRLRLVSEPDGIDGIYFLMGRTLRGGRNQPTVTELRLKEDGAWVLDANPPKSKKDGSGRKKKRHKRKANEALQVI